MSGLLGLGLAASGQRGRLQPVRAGRAQLTQVLQPTQPGWQIQLDAGALGLADFGQTRRLLNSLCGEELTRAELRQVQQGIVNISRLEGQTQAAVTPQPVPERLPPEDAVFGGTPAAVFEWSQAGVVMRGNLYYRPDAPGVLAGKLLGVLPFAGLSATGEGFAFESADFLPAQPERAVVIDASLLRLPLDHKERLLREWARWEFLPLSSLGTAIGPTIGYARWRGEGLFSIALTDRPAVEQMIDKRFPDSVVPTTVRRVAGSRIRGFDPDGPAWVFRGDHLLVSKGGGTERVAQALQSILSGDSSFESPSPLVQELRRLAALEKGWHIMVLMTDPKANLHWGALLRWRRPGVDEVTGYLVVRPGP